MTVFWIGYLCGGLTVGMVVVGVVLLLFHQNEKAPAVPAWKGR